MEKRGKVSNGQIAFFVMAAFISYHVMDLPKDMVKYCNTGGWITIIILSLLTIIFIKAMLYVSFENDGLIITDYLENLVSKNLSRLLMLTTGVFYFFYTCKKVRVCSEIVKYTVLPNTSHHVTMLLAVFIIFYGLNKGFANTVRLSEIFTIITILVFLILNIIFATKVDIYNIKPYIVLRDIPLYFRGITKLYNRFLGFDVLLLVPISVSVNKNIKKTMNKVVFFIMVGYIFLCQVCIGILGVYDIGNYDGVFFVTSRIISVESMDFLRRMDGFIYFAFFLKIFVSILIYAYISTTYIKGFFKSAITRVYSMKNFTLILNIIFSLSCYGVSLTTDNLREASYYLQFLSYVLMFFTTIVPLFIFYQCWYKKNIVCTASDTSHTGGRELNGKQSS